MVPRVTEIIFLNKSFSEGTDLPAMCRIYSNSQRRNMMRTVSIFLAIIANGLGFPNRYTFFVVEKRVNFKHEKIAPPQDALFAMTLRNGMSDPNPPSDPAELELRAKITNLLLKGWDERDGYHIPSDESDNLDELMGKMMGKRPSTYGEITELGARQLFHYMGLRTVFSSTSKADNDGTKEDYHVATNEEVTFVDLGCGSGKLLVQAYMELPSASRISGIELSSSRYNIAARAWDELKKEAKDIKNDNDQNLGQARVDTIMDIREGDLFQMDLSRATHIYVASLCFTSDMLQRLAQKLVDEGQKLQVVATLKQFPNSFNQDLGEPEKKLVEMSWTKSYGLGGSVYFYELKK